MTFERVLRSPLNKTLKVQHVRHLIDESTSDANGWWPAQPKV